MSPALAGGFFTTEPLGRPGYGHISHLTAESQFSHLKNGNNNIYFTGLFCGVDNIIMFKCYGNVQRLTLVLATGSSHLYPLPSSSSSWALLWD